MNIDGRNGRGQGFTDAQNVFKASLLSMMKTQDFSAHFPEIQAKNSTLADFCVNEGRATVMAQGMWNKFNTHVLS